MQGLHSKWVMIVSLEKSLVQLVFLVVRSVLSAENPSYHISSNLSGSPLLSYLVVTPMGLLYIHPDLDLLTKRLPLLRKERWTRFMRNLGEYTEIILSHSPSRRWSPTCL